jgi:APA family basic amino acid/polyamine antiporter
MTLATPTIPNPDAHRLGLWSACAIVVANMVGTGVFSTLSYQVHALPDERAILLLWLIGGISALAGALCCAELGAARPRSGGEYALLTHLFHPATGFAAGWISIVAGFAGPIAAAALAFSAYLGKLWPVAAQWPTAVAIALVTAISALHMLRVEIGAKFQVVTTAIKILVMIAIVLAALWLAPDTPATTGNTLKLIGSPAFAVSLVYVTYAYLGWNAALYVAGEVKDPQRTLPIALVVSTAVVTLLYIAVNWAFLRLVPFDQLVRINPGEMTVENELAVGFLAGRALFGEYGATIVGGLIAFTLVSTVSAMVLAGPRVLAAIAEDWQPFARFARRHSGGSPRAAIVFQWFLITVLLMTASFEFVVNFIGVSLTLFNMAVIAGFLRDRRLHPDRPRPFRAPFGLTAGWVFLLINGWMIVYLTINSPRAVAVSVGAILLAYLAYWPLRRHAPSEQRIQSPTGVS